MPGGEGSGRTGYGKVGEKGGEVGVGAAESAEPSGHTGCESVITRRITVFAAQLLTPPPGTEPMVSFLSAQRKGSSKGQVTIQGQEASE